MNTNMNNDDSNGRGEPGGPFPVEEESQASRGGVKGMLVSVLLVVVFGVLTKLPAAILFWISVSRNNTSSDPVSSVSRDMEGSGKDFLLWLVSAAFWGAIVKFIFFPEASEP